MIYFDRFDICEAYWLYAQHYGEYGIISRLHGMGYEASPLAGKLSHLSENGRAIYDRLVAKGSN